MVRAPWPPTFERVPPDDWVERPPETLALTYDTVQDHGWYRNLDRTVHEVVAVVRPGQLVLDYSGGTGILAERLLAELPEFELGAPTEPLLTGSITGVAADAHAIDARVHSFVDDR